MMKKIILLGVLIFSAGLATARANLLEIYKDDPGFADFGNLREFENDGAVTEVILRHRLISMVAAMTKKHDPQLASMLEQLRLIYVHTLKVDENNEKQLHETMKNLNQKLQDDGWEVIVRVREEKEENNIYILPKGEMIEGLCILSIEGEEVTFLNIVGTIDLNMLAQLGEKFDLPTLDGISEEIKPVRENTSE